MKAADPSKKFLWLTAAAAVLLAGYVFLFPGSKPPAEGARPGMPPSATGAGDAAPSFTLTSLDGSKVSLADFKGKVIILDFWATWCPPCKREIPDFIALQAKYGAKGLQVVGVAVSDQEPAVRQFAKDNGMNYPVVFGTPQVASQYGGVESIPTTFIIDREGKIRETFVGYRSADTFEAVISGLL